MEKRKHVIYKEKKVCVCQEREGSGETQAGNITTIKRDELQVVDLPIQQILCLQQQFR